MIALILREMGSSYGKSPGGYTWAILEPIGGLMMMSIVFSAAFRSPPLGISFAMFYATGMMPFMMFTDVHNKVATSLTYSRQLLVYPSVTFVDAILARFLLNVLTQIMVSYAVFFGCALMLETQITPDLPTIILSFTLASSLALGIGTLNCYLFTRFNLWHRAWSIVTRPLFLISGVFFLFPSLPEEYQNFLWWNPLVHITSLSQIGFYNHYDANFVSPAYVLFIAMSCFILGMIFLRRYHRDLLQS